MNPRTGMFAMVRNRPAVISMVQPWSGADQITTHLVDVQYKDGRQPWSDKVIWEREVDAIPVESSQLPRFDGDAMNPDDFDAMVRSARWEALLPFSEALDDRTHVRDVYAPFLVRFKWKSTSWYRSTKHSKCRASICWWLTMLAWVKRWKRD
ncbi:MAG: hypothetical protein IPN71_16990 [Fibrobacteres bacterium]|nr:hypothetical protein [Fibrobacterota bacterium]